MSIEADPREFAGKRVLITGGTKGLGRATVDRSWLAGPGSSPRRAASLSESRASSSSRRT